jgi:hypothetical protein
VGHAASKDSHLIGSFQGFSNNEAVFVVSNSGNRPGTVSDGGFMVASGTGPLYQSPLALAPPTSRDESSFVDAGQSKLVKYQASPQQAESLKSLSFWEQAEFIDLQCAISVGLINFSGKRESPCFLSSCTALARTLFPNAKLNVPSSKSAVNKLNSICRPAN